MRTLSNLVCGLLVLAGVADPGRAASVLPGNGAQRNFIWHAGGPGVKKIVLTPTYQAFPNEPPFQLGNRPHFDPLLPQSPANRPSYTIYVPGPSSSVLERIFASMGADAEPGAHPDTGLNDDPAPYAYAGTPADRANPFRGITPPTRNALAATPTGQTNRIPESRTTNLPIGPDGDMYPTASPTGDAPDPRVLSFFLDPVHGYNPGAGPAFLFPDVQVNIVGSRIDGTGVGGDFSGVIPFFSPDFHPASAAQVQISGPLQTVGAFPLSNLKASGGIGELPLRPVPDRGNLDASPNPAGAAQGVSFPVPPAASGYERNVDPATGRPRIAGATGSCRTAGAFLFPFAGSFVEVSSADPRFLQPMQGGLGIGVDPDCLKAGAAPGSVSENRWDPADYAPLLAHYDDAVNNPLPTLYDLPGSSPQNALQNHPANLGLFSWVCLATQGFLPRVDGSQCLLSIFGSVQPISPAAPFLALSEIFAALIAGEHNASAQGYFTSFAQITKGTYVRFTPVRNLNDDFDDGIITALNTEINPTGTANDFLTIDQVLSNEQRALIGCGPFYGTRCDSARGGIVSSALSSQVINYQGAGWPVGGGIDLLNTEASAFLHAWPGTFGTDASWMTTNRALGPQPGTIGFGGSPVCTRQLGGATVVLPGCRGVQSLTLDSGAGVYRAVFDDGYNVAQDGCIFGSESSTPGAIVSINATPVVGTHQDGTPVDLTSCGAPPAGQDAFFSRTRQSPTPTGNGYGDPTVAPPNDTVAVGGARTLFHPLAGCKSDADAHSSDPNVRACSFGTRDFDVEFAGGTAQIFRSEIAAASWNALALQIVTSCDGKDDDLINDPECFQPTDAWRADKCSFAAPQLCRNVQFLLALALDENRDGVPDGTGDRDGDGIDYVGSGAGFCTGGATDLPPGCEDNCPTIANSDQADQDADGVGDVCDNCVTRANSRHLESDAGFASTGDQVDSDADGFGNACDADFNQLQTVNSLDFSQMRRAVGKQRDSDTCPKDDGSPGGPCAEFDLDGDQAIIDAVDVARFGELYLRAPGPNCDQCPLDNLP